VEAEKILFLDCYDRTFPDFNCLVRAFGTSSLSCNVFPFTLSSKTLLSKSIFSARIVCNNVFFMLFALFPALPLLTPMAAGVVADAHKGNKS
jgi:hypothetical protein